jgi:hypothetical protein
MGRPLWREDGSAICSVITQWSESRRTSNHTLLSHLRLRQPGGPGSRIYIPQEQGDPVIPPGTEFPLHRLLRLEVQVTLQLTVSQSVCQGIEPILGLVTRYYFLSEGCCLFCVGRPLWREVGSVICHSQSIVIYQYLHPTLTLHMFYSILYFSILLHSFSTEYLFFCPSM